MPKEVLYLLEFLDRSYPILLTGTIALAIIMPFVIRPERKK